MDTIENNKLIAEFMSIPVINETSGIITPMYKAVGLGGWCREDELKYNLRWDWLMTVVMKLQEISDDTHGFDLEIRFGSRPACILRTANPEDRVINWNVDVMKHRSDIDAVYETVVVSIKWLNKNKKK